MSFQNISHSVDRCGDEDGHRSGSIFTRRICQTICGKTLSFGRSPHGRYVNRSRASRQVLCSRTFRLDDHVGTNRACLLDTFIPRSRSADKNYQVQRLSLFYKISSQNPHLFWGGCARSLRPLLFNVSGHTPPVYLQSASPGY